ncbi:hypothetical protein MOQ72_44200, partial [Saccharopolyspora sp. K220]|uniref:hypothetical protein n=1 Tax=Saccharopolyspora soli TaxID=2926618 RepID=UPI001F5AEB78
APESRGHCVFKLTDNVKTTVALTTGFLLVSCAGSASADLGYRELPNPCRLASPETVAGLVGPAEPELGGLEDRDPEAKSDFVSQACEWNSTTAPGWGDLVLVNLQVQVVLSQFQDGSPAISLAKAGADRQLQDRRVQVPPPPFALGDQSSHYYTEVSGVQISVFYFRKANVEVEVKYRGQGGNYDGKEVNKPREELEEAAHAVAAEALEELGPPR